MPDNAVKQPAAAPPAAPRGAPARRRPVITLSDWYRDRYKGRPPFERLAGHPDDIRSLVEALGWDLPRQAFHPAPDERAFRFLKSLSIVPKDPGREKDCSLRLCAPQTCWAYVKDLVVQPLNLTAQESVIVRPSLQCGTQRSFLDFCEVVSQANENPGQYTMPQALMLPPRVCLVLDFFNLDQYSEGIVLVSGLAWLVPDTKESP